MLKVLKSFQPKVRISNLHVRYEDLSPEAEVPMAAGLTLDKLSLEASFHGTGRPGDDEKNARDVETLNVAVSRLGVYVHTVPMGAATVIGGGAGALGPEGARREVRTAAAMSALFKEVMASDGSAALLGDLPPKFPTHQWLLGPISLAGHAHVNLGLLIGAKTRFDWAHFVVVDIDIPPVHIQCTSEMATALIATSEALMLMPVRALYKQFQRAEEKLVAARRIGPADRAGYGFARLRAAIRTTLLTLVHAPRFNFAKAMHERKEYQKLLGKALSSAEDIDGQIAALASDADAAKKAELLSVEKRLSQAEELMVPLLIFPDLS